MIIDIAPTKNHATGFDCRNGRLIFSVCELACTATSVDAAINLGAASGAKAAVFIAEPALLKKPYMVSYPPETIVITVNGRIFFNASMNVLSPDFGAMIMYLFASL